jgi:hypothetical protein
MSDDTEKTAFMAAAEVDFETRGGEYYIRDFGMTVRYKLASADAVRNALKKAPKEDSIKASAYLVADHVVDERGARIVPKGEEGVAFLLNHVAPAILGDLGKLVAGKGLDELGND